VKFSTVIQVGPDTRAAEAERLADDVLGGRTALTAA
jgi:hypothetical protein